MVEHLAASRESRGTAQDGVIGQLQSEVGLARRHHRASQRALRQRSEGAAAGGFSLLDTLLCVVYGVIAVTTMIIPGISGSFVMLLIGFYGTIIAAVADLNLLVLIPFGIGCLIGLVVTTVVYSLGRAFVYSTPEYAIMKLPYQIAQPTVGAIVGILLCFRFGLMERFDKMFK